MFAACDRSAVRRCLFGVDLAAPRVVLTPSSTLFERVGDGLPDGGGWWPVRSCDAFAVVRTPQGSAVIDALASLEPDIEIVFAGFCGALKETTPVGAIVEARVGYLADTGHPRTSKSPLRFPAVEVATVRCLADGAARARQLSETADVVDMEVAHVFESAALCRHRALAWLIVSDQPLTHPFFHENSPDLFDAAVHLARDVRGLSGWSKSPEEN